MQASLPWAAPSLSLGELTGPAWTRDAACVNLGPKAADRLFFPGRGHSADKGRAFCARCPVAEECLRFALEQDLEFGVFGGASPEERRALLKERNGTARR